MIVVNVVAYLAVVTLRQSQAAGSDEATLITAGRSLIAVRVSGPRASRPR